MPIAEKHAASFRDPSGFLFSQGGILYRQINRSYADDYSRLMESGLYERLVKAGLLIPHNEIDPVRASASFASLSPLPRRTLGLGSAEIFKVIQPERVPFISYPYEWSFSQLKDAALTTLAIHKRALKYGMALKDASAYNIQFMRGKPILIDTLSFEKYKEGQPWVAYRQFCQHFLAPLALMAYRDARLSQLMRVYIDGIPLDLASRLMPARTRLNFGLLTHIHLHASAEKRFAGEAIGPAKVSRNAMIGLVESLEGTVRKLSWKPAGTVWGNYYEVTNYSDTAFEHKKQLVKEWIGRVNPHFLWDLGANTGAFSRVASDAGVFTVAFDIDPAAVEQNYLRVKKGKEQNLLPLQLDLTNPSPALGWANQERASFGERGPAEMVLALAVVHHLAITNNVPLPQLTEFFGEMGKWLVIEFVPKSDSQVRKMLSAREDIFSNYTREGFEAAFGERFEIHESVTVRESERRLYLMEANPR